MSVEEQSAAAPLRVGIDLGTSRSAISSSSGGQFVVDSFVGWPADLVARKVLKRDLVIGREALDNRTMLDLHRPLERGLIKEGSERDLQAARELLRHLLSLVAPKNGKNRPVRAVVGVPAAALRTNKQYLRNALKGVVDSLMIVSEPFAVAYGLNALVHTLIIDIGAGTTDFCVMKGRYPTDEDQRSLTVAGDSIDAHLHKAIQARTRRRASPCSWCASGRSKHSFVGEPPAPVVVSAPVDGVPTELDITNEMRAACESIVPPIVETMLVAAVAGRSGVPAARSQQRHGRRRRRADSQSRHDARSRARSRRRRQGDGHRRADVRRLRRRTRDRAGRTGQRLGSPRELTC